MFRRWANRTNFWTRLEWLSAITSLICVLGSYWFLSRSAAPSWLQAPQTSMPLILINLVPLSVLAALLVRRFAVLRSDRARGLVASRLHLRMMRFFAVAAIVPTVLLAIFATWLFESGFRFWFSDRVETVITNANDVAQAYVAENKKRIEGDILSMARDLNAQAVPLSQSAAQFQTYVVWQAAARNLSEAIVFSSGMDVIARASFEVGQPSDRILESDLARANAGEVVVLAGSGGREDRVQALIKLDTYFDRYLYVSRKVSPQVLNQVINAEQALSEYQRLTQDRRSLQARFIFLIILVSLLILIAAILLAMWSANRMTAPVGRMVRAAGRIGKGDFSARVPSRGTEDELGVLARAMNRMAAQLQAQTRALIDANAQLDQRRRFTETVLAGVSAGVLSLSRDGVITFPNRSACELLSLPIEQLTGTSVADIAPELAALLHEAVENGTASGQISVASAGEQRSLLVRIAAEAGRNAADRNASASYYVATFDDVTEQIANQRRAAWSDVARRIAHEIKNPLTPIQLSAERLRRKYRGEISTEPEVFDACTETIIRQVGDLRRMVDEFSSFARMPKPTFRAEDLVEILRQSVFLQELVHSSITFKLDVQTIIQPFICDRRQIAQAVTNLLKNAAEAIDAAQSTKGQIDIAVREEGQTLSVTIADTGLGLPTDLRQRLTEPYVTTRARGTGLGLAIVKKIIEDHAGQLILEDRDGGGAIARLNFDLQARQVDVSDPETILQKQVSYGA
jgi:two-component system, NtrC family, nitrogen regulation sensor histidine kinase NtrY